MGHPAGTSLRDGTGMFEDHVAVGDVDRGPFCETVFRAVKNSGRKHGISKETTGSNQSRYTTREGLARNLRRQE